MSKYTAILVLTGAFLLISGCVLTPESEAEVDATLPTPEQISPITPEIEISAMPGIQLPETDQVIFTTPSGRV